MSVQSVLSYDNITFKDTVSGIFGAIICGIFGMFVMSLVLMHGFFATSNRTTCKKWIFK